jgi:glycosyltransferase involved in cell wall biosynthesis
MSGRGADELRAGLDIRPPTELAIGRGTAFPLAGWCHHPAGRTLSLEFEVAGARSPVVHHSLPRRAVWARERDAGAYAYRSGFVGIARVPGSSPAGPAEVVLRARIAGAGDREAVVGSLELSPALKPPESPSPTFPSGAKGPRVAICMASFDPPPELLRRQLDSIRQQSHGNWVCVISDDGSRPERADQLRQEIAGDQRFALVQAERLGFYGNFERALAMAPDSDLVALCDQDDRWRSDKLARLIDAIGGAELVYSDARVVRPDGEVVEPSYWSARRNNHTNLASLALANSVTGAATLFRRELLVDALPFPPAHHAPFHDHWLGLVALARGEIAYVSEPLYDYVQHEDVVIGHTQANRPPRGPLAYLRERLGGSGKRAAAVYYHDWLQLLVFCEVLRLRCWATMSEPKRRALQRLMAADRRLSGLAWLLGRRARGLFGRNETLDRELFFAYGVAGGRAPEFLALGRSRPGPFALDATVPPPPEVPGLRAPQPPAAPRG